MTSGPRHDVGADDLRALLRVTPQGVRPMLRWLADTVDGWVTLLGPAGEPRFDHPPALNPLLTDAAELIGSVTERQRHSAAADVGDYSLRVIAIDSDATLVAARPGGFCANAREMVTVVANHLRVHWKLEQVDTWRGDVERAESFTREAVLHMLMVGQVDGARRSAGALRHELPDQLRVIVIECPVAERGALARRCAETFSGAAWVIPCPVYESHVIVLAPVVDGPAEGSLSDALGELAAGSADRYVGTGGAVPLHETATGYEEAFHALAAARRSPARIAVFDTRTKLAEVIGPAGEAWATAMLAPLLNYRPERPQDPEATELIGTLRSWLTFHGRAVDQLKIHRNTLANRIRRIEQVLDCPLDELANQTRLHVALRLIGPGLGSWASQPPTLAELLSTESVRNWAQALLAPVLMQESLLTTLRVWIDNNARLQPTADALELSLPGARKRLVRIEELLGRSLLNGPSIRYDLTVALWVHDSDGAF